MKFGLFCLVPWHESRSQEDALGEAIEGVELGDGLGYNAVWIGEHHFSRHGIISGVFSFAGHVAARTRNMRIGTAVVVLPFHNAVHVAEEAAMLDVLSGGRLELGVGAGYQNQEFRGLGVNIEEGKERFAEALDVLVKAWTEERLTYHGKYTQVDDLWVIPKPVQKPHPPLYTAVSTSPASIEVAARRGLTVMLGGPTATMGEVPDAIALWRRKMEEFGHDHAGKDPPVLMNIYVAPTMEEAEQDPIEFQDFTPKVMAKVGSPADANGVLPKGYESWATRQEDRVKAGKAVGRRVLRGTPEVVCEQIEKLRDDGIRHIFGWFGYPGMPHEKVLRSIEMFGKEVMPSFTAEPAASRF